MATSPPRPFLPPGWSSIASELPDDIRIVVEAVLEDNWQQLEDKVKQMEDEAKLTNERKDMVIESKDKLIALMEYMQKLNEELIKTKEEVIEWTEYSVEKAKARRLDDLRRYQIVYEPLDTINWLLRCLYPWNRSGPEALFNQLMDDIVDKATGTLQPAFKQQYNELAAVFEVGKYETSSLTAITGAYKQLNKITDPHLFPLTHRGGIACGGKSRLQQQQHAFIVAAIQMQCRFERQLLEPALQTILVLTTDYSEVEGAIKYGRYWPIPMPAIVQEPE